jgi:4-amino-4-deoxy-L-arabinose transferase-like glycosyltransferase
MGQSRTGAISTPPPTQADATGAFDRLHGAAWPSFLAVAGCGSAILALAGPSAARLNPYYDAAVRSMGMSFHRFITGAFDPSATVAIDKPPFGEWLQVASVAVLGRGPVGLLAPAALGGAAAVPLLAVAVRRVAGTVAGVIAAIALAVLPVAVLTARSDTPDALLALALVAAAACVLRVRGPRSTAWAAVAGACVGLAFEAKLSEALVAVPALTAALALAAPRRRVLTVALFGAAAAVVGLAWPLVVTLLPGAHPWPVGSSDGSVWSTLLGYGGAGRLGAASAGHHAAVAPPGPLRLLSGTGVDVGRLFGTTAAMAVVAGLAAIAVSGRRRPRPDALVAAVLFGGWLLTGLALFSAMPRLHVRYLEAVAPAAAAVLALGIVGAARTPRRALAIAAVALAVPAGQAVTLARGQMTDGGTPGVRPPAEVAAMSGFLRAHQTGTYEAAVTTPDVAGPLIARDGRPVLLLTTSTGGHALVSPAMLRADVAAGRVRFAYLGAGSCARSCPAAARWARRAGKDVSRAAGLPRSGRLYDLRGAA